MSTPSTTAPQLSGFRSLAPWYIAVVLHSYAVTLYQVGIFDFANTQLKASSAACLWIMAFWGFAYIFIAILSGKLTARWGARKTLFLMFPLCAISQALSLTIFLVPSSNSWAPWLLTLLTLPVNFASTMCWPALETAVSQSPGSMSLPTRTSTYNLCWSITGFAAIFTRGPIETLGWPLIFIVPAALTFLTSLMLFRFAIPQSLLTNRHHDAQPDEDEFKNEPSKIQNAKTLLHMAWIGNALAYVALNVLIAVLHLVADSTWREYYHTDVPLSLAAFVTSAWGFTRVFGFLIAMRTHFWHYKARWLLGAQLALALCFLIMLVVQHPLILILAQVLLGLAAALIYSSSLYYALHTAEGHDSGGGEHAGFHEALIGIGICIGPTIGALAASGASTDPSAQLASLHRVAWSVTGLLLLGTAAMAWLSIRRKTEPVA